MPERRDDLRRAGRGVERRVVRRAGIMLTVGAVVVAAALVAGAPWSPSDGDPSPAATATPPLSAGPSGSASASAPIETPAATPIGQPGWFLDPCDGEPPTATVVDAAPPVAGDVAFELISRIGGSTTAAAVADDVVAVGVGTAIEVLGRQDSLGAATDIESSLPGVVEELALAGDRLVAALGPAGAAVLALEPGPSIGLETMVPLPGHAWDVAIAGDLALVADGPRGLRIVDLQQSGGTAIGTALDGHIVLGVATAGDHAVLAAGDEGLVIVDVGDPRSPIEIGRLFTGGYTYDVAVDNGLAYLADGWAGLRIVDISTPADPRLVGELETPSWALGVAAAAGFAFLATGGAGLSVADVSSPTKPSLVGGLPLPDGRAVGVDLHVGHAFVTDALAGVHIVDIREPARPTPVARVSPLAESWDAQTVIGRTVVAGGVGGLRVADLSDVAHPIELASLPTAISLQDIVVVGDRALVSGSGGPGASENAVVWFDLRDSASPRPQGAALLGAPDFSGFHPNARPAVAGPIVLYPLEVGLLIVDASAATPCRVAILRTQAAHELEQGYVTGVAIAGQRAYLAANADGILVVDISHLALPTIIGQVAPDRGAPIGAAPAASARWLYAIEGRRLGVFSLADPDRPRRVAGLDLPPDATQLALAEGRLFVAAGSTLLAVDVSRPRAPRIAGRIAVPGRIARISVERDRVLVSLGPDGLAIVGWRGAPGIVAASLVGGPSGSVTEGVAPGIATAGDEPIPVDDDPSIGAAWTPIPTPDIPEPERTCIVTSTIDDSLSGSLRACLTSVRAPARIAFDPSVFPIDDPVVMHLRFDLEAVRTGVTIDGTGAGVILDGGGRLYTGLVLEPRAAVIGLTVRGFTGSGIQLSSEDVARGNVVSGNTDIGIAIDGSGNLVVGNLIGTTRNGLSSAGFQGGGMLVLGSRNQIGGPGAEDSNVIAGNQTNVSFGSKDAVGAGGGPDRGNVLQGNLIGVGADGRTIVQAAVADPDSAALKVGTSGEVIVGNVIGCGAEFGDWAFHNSFIGNHLGVDRRGRPLSCEAGLSIYTPLNRVGGTNPGEGNVIRGVLTILSARNVVLGNDIEGVVILTAGATRNMIGGRAIGAGNRIDGDVAIVLEAGAVLNTIIGNRLEAAGRAVFRAPGWINYLVANES